MSNGFSQLSPEERDARITSLLLGELLPAEAEELRQVIASDPELARACERRERTIAMLRAACRQHPAGEAPVSDVQEPIPTRLSDDRRQKLLETFRSDAVAHDEPERWRIPSWFMPMAAAALLIGMLSLAALMTMSPSRKETAYVLNLPTGGEARGNSEEFAAFMVEEQVRLTKEPSDKRVQDNRIQISGQMAVDPSWRSRRYAAAKPSTVTEFRSIADPVADQPSSTLNAEIRRAEPTPTRQPQVRMEIAGNEYFFESATEGQLAPITPPPIAGEVTATPAPAVTPLPPITVLGSAVATYSIDATPDAARSKPRDNNGANVHSSDEVLTITVKRTNAVATFATLAFDSGASAVVLTNGLGTVPDQFPAFGSGSFVVSGGSGVIQNPAAVPASGPEAKPGFFSPFPAANIDSVSDGFVGLGFLNGGQAGGDDGRGGGRGGKTGKDNRYDSFGIEPMGQRTAPPTEPNINAQSAGVEQSAARGLGFDWYAKNGGAGVGGGGVATPTYFYDTDFSGRAFKESGGERLADDRAVRSVNGAGISQVSSNTPWGGVTFGDTDYLFAGTQVAQSEQKVRMYGLDIGGVQDREWDLKSFAGGGLAGSRTGFGNRLNQPVNRPAPASNALRGDSDMDGSIVAATDPAGLPVTSRDESRWMDSLRPKQKVAVGAQEGILGEQNKQLAAKLEDLEKRQKEPAPVDAVTARPSSVAPVPQPEVLTRDNAFSTFSLNVSDVSFKLAGASLEKGAMPDAASIRSEEFINAFDYRDPQPARGAPLAFAWDRARYPFAHNRDVVRFSIKTAAQGRESGKPLNIVLLLDNSGSMERADRVRIIQESLHTLTSQLKPLDKISVVTFARTASLRVDGLTGTNAIEAMKQIGAITPDGGTNLEDALDLAYRTALRHYEATAVNRVVLLTDGAANLGNVEPKSLKAKVEGFRKQGIALDCFGIGWEGYNDDLLEQLSRNGDGRYGFVNTPEEAASEFVGQLAGALRVAASDVKMQVEFNPRRVTAYRQIGYAKHQLTKEQFRDNKVDAAEIGAAESGNALYVIETNPNGEGPIATVRARFRIPQTSDYREHEWSVPYGSEVELEQANPALRLSTTASAFSEWLASSPFAGDVTTDRLLQILSGVPQNYGADPRPKKLEWMIRQAKSISGK